MIKKILLFRKDGLLRFIGHLDILRVFQRALYRADIPVQYSQGFNPHPQMCFASPLPLGYVGEKEVMEIMLEEERSDEYIVKELNATLPQGLKILSSRSGIGNKGTVMSVYAASDFTVIIPAICGREKEVEQFFSSEDIAAEKIGKVNGRKRTVTINLKPLVLAWAQNGKELYLRGQGGPGLNLNPDLLCEALLTFLQAECRDKTIVRTGLLYVQNGSYLPLDQYGAE